MSDNKQSTSMQLLIAVLLLGMSRFLTDGSERGFWMFYGAVGLVASLLWMLAYWMKERALRFLTSLDAQGRQLALANITDQDLRREIEQGLEEDPVAEGTAPVERFSFPRRMSRRLVIAYIVGTIVALAGAALAAFSPSPDLRLVSAATALLAAVATIAWGWWRSKLLASAIEISPFAISEVWPDGRRRTMLWRDVWWLRNRPRLGRVEVLGFDRRMGIHVHYHRVAFKRAAELIIDHGGFRTGAE